MLHEILRYTESIQIEMKCQTPDNKMFVSITYFVLMDTAIC